jgi:hypothetical protein
MSDVDIEPGTGPGAGEEVGRVVAGESMHLSEHESSATFAKSRFDEAGAPARYDEEAERHFRQVPSWVCDATGRLVLAFSNRPLVVAAPVLCEDSAIPVSSAK